eukprot:m.48250 g.48250  ORF g.48250 m.48250 type:complete len:1043 (-) comp7384_c0_seq1:220-3348(-)
MILEMTSVVSEWLSQADLQIYSKRFEKANFTTLEHCRSLTKDVITTDLKIVDEEHVEMIVGLVKQLKRESVLVLDDASLEESSETDGKVKKREKKKKKWGRFFKRMSKVELGVDITMNDEDRESLVKSVQEGTLDPDKAVEKVDMFEEGQLGRREANSNDLDKKLFRARRNTLQLKNSERVAILKRVKENKLSVEEASEALHSLESKLKSDLIKTVMTEDDDEDMVEQNDNPIEKPIEKPKPKPKAVVKKPPVAVARKKEPQGPGTDMSTEVFDDVSSSATSLQHMQRAKQTGKRPPNRARLRKNRQQAIEEKEAADGVASVNKGTGDNAETSTVADGIPRPKSRDKPKAALRPPSKGLETPPTPVKSKKEINFETAVSPIKIDEKLLILQYLQEKGCGDYYSHFIGLGYDSIDYVRNDLDAWDLQVLLVSNKDHLKSLDVVGVSLGECVTTTLFDAKGNERPPITTFSSTNKSSSTPSSHETKKSTEVVPPVRPQHPKPALDSSTSTHSKEVKEKNANEEVGIAKMSENDDASQDDTPPLDAVPPRPPKSSSVPSISKNNNGEKLKQDAEREAEKEKKMQNAAPSVVPIPRARSRGETNANNTEQQMGEEKQDETVSPKPVEKDKEEGHQQEQEEQEQEHEQEQNQDGNNTGSKIEIVSDATPPPRPVARKRVTTSSGRSDQELNEEKAEEEEDMEVKDMEEETEMEMVKKEIGKAEKVQEKMEKVEKEIVKEENNVPPVVVRASSNDEHVKDDKEIETKVNGKKVEMPSQTPPQRPKTRPSSSALNIGVVQEHKSSGSAVIVDEAKNEKEEEDVVMKAGEVIATPKPRAKPKSLPISHNGDKDDTTKDEDCAKDIGEPQSPTENKHLPPPTPVLKKHSPPKPTVRPVVAETPGITTPESIIGEQQAEKQPIPQPQPKPIPKPVPKPVPKPHSQSTQTPQPASKPAFKPPPNTSNSSTIPVPKPKPTPTPTPTPTPAPTPPTPMEKPKPTPKVADVSNTSSPPPPTPKTKPTPPPPTTQKKPAKQPPPPSTKPKPPKPPPK